MLHRYHTATSPLRGGSRMTRDDEYAVAGVNYAHIAPFKQAMLAVGRRTLHFPHRRDVAVTSLDHGASFQYFGRLPHVWVSTSEGLGNKNWIAEWMSQHAHSGRSYYDGIG